MAYTKIKNIYDMAGNMWEWTTEIGQHHTTENQTENEYYAVIRGGTFVDEGEYSTIGARHGERSSTKEFQPWLSFRVVLYIK